MGLLLSVLVTCVGVIELLTFYHNINRRVIYQPVETSLNTLENQYIKGLEDVRDRLEIQLRTLKKEENVLSTSANTDTYRRNIPKDIDVEANDKTLVRSRSSSPSPFLVGEKKSSSYPTKQFVVSEKLQALRGIKKSKAQECLPEYPIKKETSSDVPRYVVLKDHNGPLPLPEKFLITEHENNDVSSKKLVYNTGEVDGEIYYRRSPSHFPSFDLTAPRNSVCSDLLDDSISVAEVDEFSRSNSHSPVNVEATYELNNAQELNNNSDKIHITLNSSSHNSTEYWNNKTLVVPKKKSKSRPTSPGISKEQQEHILLKPNSQKRRSKLESNSIDFISTVQSVSKTPPSLDTPGENKDGLVFESDDDEESVEVQMFTENIKGVDGGDREEGCIKKKTIKRKWIKNIGTTGNKSDSIEKINSSELVVLPTENAKFLPKTRSVSENTSTSKSGEPFWLIFSGEYTKAMNKDFHGQHFCCWQCDESLTGQRYVLRDDHPYCVSCYESVFANACEKCSRTIGIDSKDLSYKDKHWHEACFLCTTCGESLVDKQFGSKGDRIYCGRCYDEQFASRCDGCHEIFRAGTKKMEYKTRQWHEKCFCCCVCKVPIGTQSFIPREQEIFCAKCYEEKFATRCIKCNKVITSGGVTYKNEPWHRECFTCTNCQKSLAGERFTSRDEKPYCADCFGELFAKRCFACNRPITGIGGTKFISFEDRHWHNDCFFCASCRTSLVGRGFITDQDDIICPECAKQKLM